MVSKLVVAEHFYSIQGEGASIGRPAVFLRLAGCNLQCNGFSYLDPKSGQHLGCDSKLVWRQGTPYHAAALVGLFAEHGYLAALASGAHLVITGGEPMLQQAKLVPFLEELAAVLPEPAYIEVETNATCQIDEAMLVQVRQFNVSPKLNNSGETRAKAYCLAVLQQLAALPQAVFKFVIQDETDVSDVMREYVEALGLDRRRVWLMPEGGTKEILQHRAVWLVELCKKYHLNYTPRLQVDIWGEVTGV